MRGEAGDGSWTAEGHLHASTYALTGDPLGEWEIDAGVAGLDPAMVEDIYLLIPFTVAAP